MKKRRYYSVSYLQNGVTFHVTTLKVDRFQFEMDNFTNHPDPVVDNIIRRAEEEVLRTCWVCFASDEEEEMQEWSQPCNCRGTTKWVHQGCLQRWVDEKQKGNPLSTVHCPQCGFEYMIVFPDLGKIILVLDHLESIIKKGSPYAAASIVVASVYWNFVTFGAITVMQVCGREEGMSFMEKTDPFALLIGLPAIPALLVVFRLFHWEDIVLNFLRKHSWKIPLLNHVLPGRLPEQYADPANPNFTAMPQEAVSATRIICGGLLLPTVATFIGNAVFRCFSSNFQRVLMGGMSFIVLKGILRIYHKQKTFVRMTQRKILDKASHQQPQFPLSSEE